MSETVPCVKTTTKQQQQNKIVMVGHNHLRPRRAAEYETVKTNSSVAAQKINSKTEVKGHVKQTKA